MSWFVLAAAYDLLPGFMSSSEEDHRACKAMWVRLCETLPKTDGYDFMRLDRRIIYTTSKRSMLKTKILGSIELSFFRVIGTKNYKLFF
jgi:hypothetical protein